MKDKKYIIKQTKGERTSVYDPMTLQEAWDFFSYTLEVGKAYQHEKGNKKINMQPKTISSLLDNLQKAKCNAAKNGYSDAGFYATEFRGE